MKNNWLILVIGIFIVLSILYLIFFKAVWNSDLPLWLKILLTK